MSSLQDATYLSSLAHIVLAAAYRSGTGNGNCGEWEIVLSFSSIILCPRLRAGGTVTPVFESTTIVEWRRLLILARKKKRQSICPRQQWRWRWCDNIEDLPVEHAYQTLHGRHSLYTICLKPGKNSNHVRDHHVFGCMINWSLVA